jgi:predicted amidophosphoribosyltransferase
LLLLRDELLAVAQIPNIDATLALDWTKVPSEAPAPQWANTTAYQLVHDGKYRFASPKFKDEQRVVGRTLADWLISVIDRHPLLRQTDGVVVVPGHDARRESFGARLAVSVAHHNNRRTVDVRAVHEFRVAAKNVDELNRANLLKDQFECNQKLERRRLLIIDDVIHTGSTVAEIGGVLRTAGAAQILALGAAKTLRSPSRG